MMTDGEESRSTLRRRNVPKEEPPEPETVVRRVVRTLKKVDMYTKVQTLHTDIITPTPMGAIVSVAAVLILLYLFIGELSAYTQVEYITNFKIFDVSDKGAAAPTVRDKLRLTFDVSFEHLPCEFLSVDYLDMFGTHDFNLHNNIKRKSILNNDDDKKGDNTGRRGRRLLQVDANNPSDVTNEEDDSISPDATNDDEMAGADANRPPDAENDEHANNAPDNANDDNIDANANDAEDDGSHPPNSANDDYIEVEPNKSPDAVNAGDAPSDNDTGDAEAGGVYGKGVVANPKQVGGKPEADKPKPLGDEVKEVPTAADNKDKLHQEEQPLVEEKPSFHDNKAEMKIGGVKLKIVDGGGLHEIIEGGDEHKMEHYDGVVVDLDERNFKAYIAEHDIVLIDFFAPWCIWCQRLAPVWSSTAISVAEQEDLRDTVGLAKIDCTSPLSQGICRQHRVHAYPTIFTYKRGKLNSHRPYRGDRTTLGLLKHIRNLPKTEKEASEIAKHESDKSLLKFYSGPGKKAKDDNGDNRLSMGACVAWRQTGGCDPKGDREDWNDAPCTSLIYNKLSGYCECKGGVRTMELGCKHEIPYFTCEEECRKAVKDRVGDGQDEIPLSEEIATGLERVNQAVIDFEKNVAERYGGVTNQQDHDAPESLNPNGCTVAGFLEISKVPGSLLFTAASPWHDFATEEVDMTHTVNQFFFDELNKEELAVDNAVLLRTALHGAKLDLQLNAMRNKTYHSMDGDTRMTHISHEHFLKMIETKFSHAPTSQHDLHAGFQYTATSHKFSVSEEEGVLPSVRMIFNIDPIGVHITLKPKHLYKFVTSSCAILGGVFTVFGLFDKVMHSLLFTTPRANPYLSPRKP